MCFTLQIIYKHVVPRQWSMAVLHSLLTSIVTILTSTGENSGHDRAELLKIDRKLVISCYRHDLSSTVVSVAMLQGCAFGLQK